MSDVIEDRKTVWAGWSNIYGVPICVAAIPETAYRLGKELCPQGSTFTVAQTTAYLIDGRWRVIACITEPNMDDRLKAQSGEARDDAIRKALALGLTQDDIAAIMGGV
jgi:hypothetical protein